MQEPQLIINWGAIAVSVIAVFGFGGLWYGPLMGKAWMKAMNMKMEDCKPDPKVMRKSFTLQFIGLFLTAYVLAHSGQIWRPSVWGVGQDMGPNYMWGFMSGFFTWIGFYVPMQLGKVAWEMRPWKLFFINTAHDFLTLQIMCQILAHWR